MTEHPFLYNIVMAIFKFAWSISIIMNHDIDFIVIKLLIIISLIIIGQFRGVGRTFQILQILV